MTEISKALLLDVIDGDTIEVLKKHTNSIFEVDTIRLKGVDTAETYGVPHMSREYKKGIKQKGFVKKHLPKEKDIHLREHNYPITVKEYNTGSFGRTIAQIEHDGLNINKILKKEFDV